jgi:hypothetical protein
MARKQAVANGEKTDSVAVTVISVLSLAVSVLALVASFIPYLSGVAVFIGAPGVFGALVAAGVALLRKNRLVVPAVALIAAAVPAARYNWRQMRIVWVESAELCHPPELLGFSLFAFLGTLAVSMDHKNAVGNNICHQLGRDYADSDCDREIGRIKCE